jgi:hypothetical protein
MIAAALTVLLTCAPARAASAPVAACLPAADSADGPQTLADLRACQDKARAAAVRKARRKGRTLTANEVESIDESQRAETRSFLAQNDAAAEGAPGPAAAAPGAKSSAALPAGATPGKLGGATPDDLAHVDAGSAAAIAGLQARLQAAAGDGSGGVTPAMAGDIVSVLTQAQGGVSPDMKALLDAVAKDGGKLTPDTMKLLQGAGRSAKSEGLDLNIDPGTEKELLTHDFEGDKKYFPAGGGAAPAQPGSL